MSISTARPADIESRATLECWRPAANADITAVTVATSRPMAISDSKRVSPLRMGVLAHLSAVLDWRRVREILNAALGLDALAFQAGR